jgi:competence ComEA-like helix-hairpin-helix protein
MDSSFFKQIYPYINLPVVKEVGKSFKKEFAKNKLDSLFDLNLVDSIKLLDVYGIGPVLSSRVVRYREKLGGFVSENQLHEVYGLDSIVVKRLSDLSFINQSFKPKKINLNTFTEKQLSSHPYLSRSDASAIVAYRFQHGSFQSLEDIRNIQSIDKETFIKIESYLTVDH